MNIPKEIYEYAQKYGIDWTSTGGGCDFITRTIGSTELKLTDPKDLGWCPDSIDDECVVCIVTAITLEDTNPRKFPNCRDAIKWMANARTYKIPCSWEMYSIVEVMADTQMDAFDIVEGDAFPLPQGDYVSGSFEIDYDQCPNLEVIENKGEDK